MTRTYQIICPSCNGRGYIPNPEIGLTTVATVICPACNGNKSVTVIETIDKKDDNCPHCGGELIPSIYAYSYAECIECGRILSNYKESEK